MCIKYKINEMQMYTKQHLVFYGSFIYSNCDCKICEKNVLRAFLYNLTLCYSEHENMKTKIRAQLQMQSLYVKDPLTM